MANQNERPTRNTTPTQSQLDSLASFLSDWSEASVQPPTLAGEAEEEKETEDVQTRRSSLLEHPPLAAYDFPSPGALRRRSIFATDADADGAGAGDQDHHDRDNGDGAMAPMAIMNSLAMNPLPILPLPFATLHEQRQMDQEAPLPLHQEVTSPPSSALMSLDNDKEPSASATLGGGVGGNLPPPPPLLNPRPTEHRVDTDTPSDAPSSSSTSTSSSITTRPPAAQAQAQAQADE